VPRLDDALVQRLYARAGADRWNVSRDAFAAFLCASVHREFGDIEPDPARLENHCRSLHLEDLALASACAEGIESAWEAFILQHRPTLYRAADALDPSGGAREAADSLYGELFGLKSHDGQRHSHLRYYHGRSSLATWLRAVLAQRYVDRKRADARIDQLPDGTDDGLAAPPVAPEVRRDVFHLIRRVIAAVIATLPARDRLRLRCYYAQAMTLAEIGRMLGESEATASRSLARTRRAIREQVERKLLEEEEMSEAAISECFAAVVADSGPLDLADLLGPSPPEEGPSSADRSARKETTVARSRSDGHTRR
jgi:RNA polymerase sigma factor (sigma-70 family)